MLENTNNQEQDYEEGGLYKEEGDETKSIAQLMEDLGITGTVEEGTAPINDNFSSDARGWTGKFKLGKKRLTLYYYTGSGIKEDATLLDILSCALGDMSYADVGFEEFCSECGYDSDSRKAEAIYKKILHIERKLKAFLDENYDTFLNAE